MRPYRGLTKDGKWVKGWHCQIGNRHFIATEPYDIGWSGGEVLKWHIAGFIEVIPETVGQQIGLPDKNGVEIYAGDKVHIWSTFYKKDMPDAEVFWNEKAAKFDVKPADGQYHHWLAMGHHKGWFIEVIGNIHQEVKI